MERKHFPFYTKDGELSIQFNLDFDGTKPIISDIEIRPSYKVNLPTHTEIKSINGQLQFYREYDSIDSNNRHILKHEYFNDNLSKDLIAKIYEVSENSIPSL